MRRFLFVFIFLTNYVRAQVSIQPPNWWSGLQLNKIQLLVHGVDIAKSKVVSSNSGIQVKKIHRFVNPNFIIIDLNIADGIHAGEYHFEFSNKNQKQKVSFPILKRESFSAGLNPGDATYQIMPDRFANGNLENDNLIPTTISREKIDKRHGGDLQGVIHYLDYIKELGMTNLWLTPIYESNSGENSYHGYETTNFYKIDPRLGSIEDLKKLSRELHRRGMKLTLGTVFNHIGENHIWNRDYPSPFVVKRAEQNEPANQHIREPLHDPYAIEYDKEAFLRRRVIQSMIDLDYQNRYILNYFVQHAIWMVETFQLQAFRVDTIAYQGKDFLKKWVSAIVKEYPSMTFFGEEASYFPSVLANWQRLIDQKNNLSFSDFPTHVVFFHALMEKERFHWNEGWIRLYRHLSQDHLYANPYILQLISGNHDRIRLFTHVKEDFTDYKMALSFFATTRGIPQFLYGTELLMQTKIVNFHGVREDFPGFLPGSNFVRNLSIQQKKGLEFFKKLMNWRKTSLAIKEGRLYHKAPTNGVYMYMRKYKEEAVLVILNKNNYKTKVDLSVFGSLISPFIKGRSILDNKAYDVTKAFYLERKGAYIMELEK